jgi:hypothetical protein
MSAAIAAVDSDLTQDGTELTVVVTTDVVGTDLVVVTAGFETGAAAGIVALTTENRSKAGAGVGDGEADGAAVAKEVTKDCICVVKFSNGAFGPNELKSSAPVSVRPERVP